MKKNTEKTTLELVCENLNITTENYHELEEKHGFLIVGSVKNKRNGKEYYGLFKEPTINQSKAVAKIAKTDDTAAAVAMYNNCVVLVHPTIEKRELLKVVAVRAVVQHIEDFEVDVKNV